MKITTPAGLGRLCMFGLMAQVILAAGCRTLPRAGKPEPREGDEIVAAGQFFHTGARVVLWMDPGGYDGYRVERRFAPFDKSSWADSSAELKSLKTPNRYGLRAATLTTNQIEKVRGGGWDLPLLQNVVDQLVMHFDVCGTSRTCFLVLQDDRDLSVHFMVDLDGTIYQTLDLLRMQRDGAVVRRQAFPGSWSLAGLPNLPPGAVFTPYLYPFPVYVDNPAEWLQGPP